MNKLSELPYLFAMDTPLPVAAAEGCVRIKGWCFLADGAALPRVRLNAAGVTLEAAEGTERDDVREAFPDHPQAARSGFEIIGYLPPGVHCARLEAGSDAAGWMLLREFSVCVDLAPLLAAIDLPRDPVITANTSVEGWCLHPQFELAALSLHYGNIVVPIRHHGLERADLAASQPHLPHARHSGFVTEKRLRHGAGPLRLCGVTKCGQTFFAPTGHRVAPATDRGWTPSDPATGAETGEGDLAAALFKQVKRHQPRLPSFAFYLTAAGAEQHEAVAATLASLAAQLVDRWELRLFCPAPEADAFNELAATEPRLHLNPPDPSRGATAADFVGWLRPGDRLVDGALAQAALALHAAPHVDVLAPANTLAGRLVEPAPWSGPFLANGTAEVQLPWIARRSLVAESLPALKNVPEPLELLLSLAARGARFATGNFVFVERAVAGPPPADPVPIVAADAKRRGLAVRVERAEHPPRLVFGPAQPAPAGAVAVVVLPGGPPRALAQTLNSVRAVAATAVADYVVLGPPPAHPLDAAALADAAATLLAREAGETLAQWINRAADTTDAPALLFLAPGLEWCDAGALDRLWLHAAAPATGAVAPRILAPDARVFTPAELSPPDLAAEAQRLSPSLASTAHERRRVLHTREVAWATAHALLVPRAPFEEIGGFAPAFDGAGFDLDLGLRLHAAGRPVVVCAEATVRWSGSPPSPADGFNRALFLDRWTNTGAGPAPEVRR
jgi:hypothetical protein